jgi:acyl-CoA dehydrogenase
MDFAPDPAHAALREGVGAVVRRFDDAYWRARDEDGVFPFEFREAMAGAGWLGLTMPQAHGGAGLGVVEACVMMHEVCSYGGGMTAASAVHIGLFGPHAIVVSGTPEQQARWLPPLISGADLCCFAFTEPDGHVRTFAEKVPGGYRVRGQKLWASTLQVANKIMLVTRTTPLDQCARESDGLTLFYADVDRSRITAQVLHKLGCTAIDANTVFIDDLFVPEADRIGEEGLGFRSLIDSLNPERILIGIEAVAIGRDALGRAARYANERVVGGRPIGMNQAVQHPLAENWCALEAAYEIGMKAAWLYDAGLPCMAEANAAKLLGARAGYDACFQSILTHGGFGYAREFHVERLLREITMARITPISDNLILSAIAEKELGLPRSF